MTGEKSKAGMVGFEGEEQRENLAGAREGMALSTTVLLENIDVS
jgi:hypothetical protein